MKTVFINISLRPESRHRALPVGLAYVMTAVKKAGIDFDLIDMDIDNLSLEQLERILENQIYDVYALGCIVTGYRWVRRITSLIKNVNPRALIIAGNSVATSIPKLLLSKTQVDIAVLGEGDYTMPELLHAIDRGKDLREIRGMAFSENGNLIATGKRPIEQDLDQIGFPDWELFDLKKYRTRERVDANIFKKDMLSPFPLNSARGCPFSCTFCYHVFKEEKYRQYSEDAVINEIQRLHHRYGADYIAFFDELTFPNLKSIGRMVERLNQLDFDVGWSAQCRADLFSKSDVDFIRDIKRAGCDRLSFSLENGEEKILEAMNKKISVGAFIEQTEALQAGGIVPTTSVIFGYPQETRESIRKTIAVCERSNLFPSVGFLLPLPGTPIYDWARNHGYIDDEENYMERIGDRQDLHVNLTSMRDDELLDTVQHELHKLAHKQGLKLDSVIKTTTYQKPRQNDKAISRIVS